MQAVVPRPAGCSALHILCCATRYCCSKVPVHFDDSQQGMPAVTAGAAVNSRCRNALCFSSVHTGSSNQALSGGMQQQSQQQQQQLHHFSHQQQQQHHISQQQQQQQQHQELWQERDVNKQTPTACTSVQLGNHPHSSGREPGPYPTPPLVATFAEQHMMRLLDFISLSTWPVVVASTASKPYWRPLTPFWARYGTCVQLQQPHSAHHTGQSPRRQYHSQRPPETQHSTPGPHQPEHPQPQSQHPPQQPANAAAAAAGSHLHSAGQGTYARPSAQATAQATTGPQPVSASQSKLPGSAFTTLPNMLSLSRVAMSPWLAYCIAAQQWPTAVALTAAAGASDWLDGFLARRLGHTSKLGSYLDPLADKVFVATAVGTMGALDMVPSWLAVLVVGRDSAQVVGMFWYRLRMFDGAWPGASAFFDVDHPVQSSLHSNDSSSSSSSSVSSAGSTSTYSGSSSAGSDSSSSSAGSGGSSAGGGSSLAGSAEDSSSASSGVYVSSAVQEAHTYESLKTSSNSSSNGSTPGAGSQQPIPAGQLPMIRPLLISKANTALIMALVAACMGHQWQGFPDRDVLDALEVVAASTTAVSAAAYARLHWQGKLLSAAADAGKQ